MRLRTATLSAPTVLLTCLIGAAATPCLVSAQEALRGEALVAKLDSLAEATLAEGPSRG